MGAKLDVSKVVGEVTILPVKTCNLPCYEKAAPNDRFGIDHRIKRNPPGSNRHGLESDGRASTSPIGKRRAFDDEVRPVRRGRCAFLITFPGQRDWTMEVTRVRITDGRQALDPPKAAWCLRHMLADSQARVGRALCGSIVGDRTDS